MRRVTRVITALAVGVMWLNSMALAVEESGICAKVRVRLSQDVTLTRAAFRATLEVTNAPENVTLENVNVTLDIRNEADEPSNSIFGIRPPELTGIGDVSGHGAIPPGTIAQAVWVIIPTRDAAPEAPTRYLVGGTLSYTQEGQQIDMPLFAAPILVKPDPLLYLDYFWARDVYADDARTPQIEPSEPFPLGLIIKNLGKGTAYNVRIVSSQPEIVENEKGLLIAFQIISSQVNDQEASPSLAVNLGNIAPAGTSVARWSITSTLAGTFSEYSARFEHIDELGDPRLSLIDEVRIHELNHSVRVDVPADDNKPDFLVNDVPDDDHMPDKLYNSDGTTADVSVATNASTTGSLGSGNLEIHLTATCPAGWVYIEADDLGQELYNLVRVIRDDGREILVYENAWTTHRTTCPVGQGCMRIHKVRLFDWDSTGSYTLYYEQAGAPRRVASEAKKMANGESVELNAADGSGLVVTAIFTDCIYVESQDRSSGMMVKTLPGNTLGLVRGSLVRVTGKLGTETSGERYVLADVVDKLPGTAEIGPLGLLNRAVGGADFGLPADGRGQYGVAEGIGLNNIGLLVKIWGLVPQVGGGYVYINDGSGLMDGTLTGADPNSGVRVIYDPTGIALGDYLEVTGISSCFGTPSGLVAPRILTRDTQDVRVIGSARRAIRGHVTLQDYNGDLSQVPVTVELRPNGLPGTPQIVNLDAGGGFSIADVNPGAYDIAIKASHWLRSVLRGIVVATEDVTGLEASLVNGDADGSNDIGMDDLTVLRNNWGSSDPMADLDGSGLVGMDDYTILARNWGKSGE